MAPAIKDEKTADENRDLMEVDEEHASEMEEQEEEEEEEDEDMDEEPDVAVSADKIEIVRMTCIPLYIKGRKLISMFSS
jgi:hypothetical protein